MLTCARDPRRMIPAWIAFLAVASVLSAPLPEPGRRPRLNRDGPFARSSKDCIVSLPTSPATRFPGASSWPTFPRIPPLPVTIYRISRDGTRTAFFTNDQVWASFMEFDPAARLLYSVAGAHVDVITEAGAWVEHDSVPDRARIRGTVLGPDGTLYLLDGQNLRIVRYDRATHAFPTVTTLGALAGSEVGERDLGRGRIPLDVPAPLA
jgi:hypothetical protein